MAYIHRLISLFLLFFVPSSFSSVLSDGYKYAYVLNTTPSAYLYNSPSSACSALVGKTNSSGRTFISCTPVGPSGAFDYNATVIYTVGSKNYESTGFYLRRKISSCPSGYYISDDGACSDKPPPDPCEGLENYCAAKQNNSFDWQVKGKSKSRQWTCQSAQSWVSGIGDGYTGYVDDFPGCSKGCMGRTSGFDLSHQDETGAWYTVGQGKYVGSTCEPSVIADLNGDQGDEETPPEVDQNADKTCLNGFKGTVNGVSVCLPPKSSSGVTELETKDNGDGTKTESKTQVQCENGKCSITKNTTTTNSETNNVVNSSSVTTTVDQSDYCSKNPTAGVCKDETGKGPGDSGKGEGEGGEFGGSCSSGFTCDGDAIQCAIAKEQHIRACQMNEDLLKTEEYKAWQSAKAWDGKSVTGNLPGNKEFNISIKSSDEFIGSGSCPSDQTIDLPFGTSFTIPLSEMCPWLIIFGEGLVIVSYISGALIILRRQS